MDIPILFGFQGQLDCVHFHEYKFKCTQTPLYSKNRIAEIAKKADREAFDWQDNWPDIGQCETDT